MATALARRYSAHLRESGFSEKQVEGFLQVTEQQAQELLESIQERAEQTEKKTVTREYLDLQVDNIKKSLVIQTIGVVLSGMVLLGWFVNYLDNKTRFYVEARFDQQKTRFNDFKGNVNMRFDKIEGDIKEIRTLVLALSRDGFSRKPAQQ